MAATGKKPPARQVQFQPAEMARIRVACQALGISYGEFMHFAVMQAVTELEGYAREEAAARRQPRPLTDRLRALA
jgi:hypothetical protein